MGPKQKILFIITKSVWGGAQKYVHDLATNLPRDRFEPAVITGGSGPLVEKLKAKGISALPLETLQEGSGFFETLFSLKNFWTFFALVSLFKKEQPHVVHLNSSKIGGLGALAAWWCKFSSPHPLAVVFTVHGWPFREDRPWWQKITIFLASWFSSLFQDKIILISTEDAQIAKYFISPKKLSLIFNGIGESALVSRAVAHQKFFPHSLPAIDSGATIIGTIAEFTKNKGLTYFIQALGNLDPYRHKIHAVIVGDGEDRGILEEEIRKHGLGQKIQVTGFLPDAHTYANGFDIFVLPSIKEGLPYVLMEAMRAGLPVVASRVGGIPDLIRHGQDGLLVGAKNPSHLAEALEHLLQEKEKRTFLGANAREKIRTHFRIEEMVRKTSELYQSI